MEIVLHKRTVEEAKVTGERGLLRLEFLLKRLDGRLYLSPSALLLVGADYLLSLLEVLLLAYVEVNGNLLIKLGDLSSEITGARMDNEVLSAVLVYVYLNKVITAAKCSKRPLKSLGVLEMSVAAKLREVKSLLPSLPHLSAAGNVVRRLVYLFKININVAKVHGIHSATDIHSHHRGDYFIGYGHGRADGTTLARMNVGHYSYLRGRKRLGITHRTYLLPCLLLKGGGKAPCGVKLSYYLYHIIYLLYVILSLELNKFLPGFFVSEAFTIEASANIVFVIVTNISVIFIPIADHAAMS